MKSADRTHMIDRRTFLRAAAAVAGGLMLHGSPPAALAQPVTPPRPNIVMIMTDDQAWDQLGVVGRYDFLQTPNLDRLAAEGAIFQKAFVVQSLCTPSRATILTGVYPHIHGLWDNSTRDLPASLPNLGQLMRQAGYETAFIGKTHFGTSMEPLEGFDYWFGHRGQGDYFNNTFNENGRLVQPEGYYTDIVTDKAIEWIQRDHDKPYCLFIFHKAIHTPLETPPRHEGLWDDVQVSPPQSWGDDLSTKPVWVRAMAEWGQNRWRQRMESEPVPERVSAGAWSKHFSDELLRRMRPLIAVDEGLGRILEALEQQEQLDDTLILFTSDNGQMSYEHSRHFYAKMFAWEESMTVPFLVRYPRMIQASTRIDQMVLNLDIPATFLDLAGAAVPDHMQGRSIVALMQGNTDDWRTSFLYEWISGTQNKRPPVLAVRTDRFKYMYYPEWPDDGELYDLQADPDEIHNLFNDPQHADTLAEMRAELERLKQQTGWPGGAHHDRADWLKELFAPASVPVEPIR